MKKLSMLALGVLSLLLFSFTQKNDDDVTKLVSQLYEVNSTTKFAKEDQAKLNEILSKNYGIRDFETQRSVDFIGNQNKSMKGTWIFRQTAYKKAINKELAYFSSAKLSREIPKDVLEVVKILDKYSSNK